MEMLVFVAGDRYLNFGILFLVLFLDSKYLN